MTMAHSKIFLGIDGSKRANFITEIGKYFIVAGVSCTDFQMASSIETKILEKYGEKKGAEIYDEGKWEETLNILASNEFRFHILYLDKGAIAQEIAVPLKAKTYVLADSPPNYQSKATVKIFSLHTWLVVSVLGKAGFAGDANFKINADFSGPAWTQNHEEITQHANNMKFNSCDYTQAKVGEYPLVRFADYIAPFLRLELENNGFKSKIFNMVSGKAIFYPLVIIPMPGGGWLHTLPPWAMESFTPW